MKNILLKSIGVLAVSVLATACIQETFPEGATQTSSQIAKSSSATEGILKGLPASMNSFNTAGYYTGYEVHTDFGIGAIHLMTEFMLNDVATLGDNPYYNRFYAQAYNQYQGSRYIYCAYFWTCYYQWIKIANDIISVLPENPSGDQRAILGKAYAYRAYFYLDLARLYEAKEVRDTYAIGKGYKLSEEVLGLTVPIITPDLTESEANNNPRAQREDMYKFILADLDKAEELLSGETFTYTEPSSYLVDGLRARAYIEMGYWGGEYEQYFAKAAECARKVITESKRVPLTKDQWQDPKNGFNSGSANSAWIFGQTLASENQENIITYTAHISSEASWGYAPLSQIGVDRNFYNRISDSDWRKACWLDPDFVANPEAAQWANVYKFTDKSISLYGDADLEIPAMKAYQNIKFRPYQGEIYDYNTGNCADHCLMRIEEMYFIEAEALAHTQGVAAGKAALESFIKANRDAQFVCTGSDLDAFLKDDLLFEKRIEFWGEGILIFDFKRLDEGIERGYAGTNQASVYRLNCTGRSPQWNFTITRGEFQNNRGITDATNNPDPSDTIELWLEK